MIQNALDRPNLAAFIHPQKHPVAWFNHQTTPFVHPAIY